MNRLRLYLLALAALFVCSVKADEGMWLLQLMQQQHSIDMMKKQGLKLEAQDLYNPNGISLKDAVGIFGGGCTGEIISPEGLILTNHHFGYASIQQHSSVEHDYLTDGFWATSRDKELPTPGLQFTFIERIEDMLLLKMRRLRREIHLSAFRQRRTRRVRFQIFPLIQQKSLYPHLRKSITHITENRLRTVVTKKPTMN